MCAGKEVVVVVKRRSITAGMPPGPEMGSGTRGALTRIEKRLLGRGGQGELEGGDLLGVIMLDSKLPTSAAS